MLQIQSRLRVLTIHYRYSLFSGWRPRNTVYCSFHSLPNRQHETVNLKVGGSGHITLDISRPKSVEQNCPANLLVHFPSGPFPNNTTPNVNDDSFDEILLSQLPSTTLVKVNYRMSSSDKSYRFPIPIHDVSVALDYLTSSISSFNATQNETPKICMTGTHVGGALATTLTLTEPNKIHALAVSNPLVDWVGLDEILAKAKKALQDDSSATVDTPRKKGINRDNTPRISPASSEATAKAARFLIHLRSTLFPTPSAYFDPFASPILFLRAPGRDTPLTRTAATITPDQTDLPFDLSSLTLENEDTTEPYPDQHREDYGPYDDDYSTHSSSSFVSTSPSISDSTDTSQSSLSTPKRRKVLRRWLPNAYSSDTTVLPPTLIMIPSADSILAHQNNNDAIDETGLASIYRSQGTELVELMRRACFWGREKGFAEERVTIQEFGVSNTEAEARSRDRKDTEIRTGANSDSEHDGGIQRNKSTKMEGMAKWIRDKFRDH